MRKLKEPLDGFSQVEPPPECSRTPNPKLIRPSKLPRLLENGAIWREASVEPCVFQDPPRLQLTSKACPTWRQRPQLPLGGCCHGAHSTPKPLPLPGLHNGILSASNHGGIYCAPGSTDIVRAPVYRRRNGHSERLGDLPKATEREHRSLNPSLPGSGV